MYPFQLPILEYSYDALEPIIDAQTMLIHHTKHHQTYVNNLNDLLSNQPTLQSLSITEILEMHNTIPAEIKQHIINNAGGHLNHSFFWELLTPSSHLEPIGEIKDSINDEFENFDIFKDRLVESGMKCFGSGWVWLVMSYGRLEIITTSNQDNPLMINKIPILAIDLWEHAYYLKYQNKRADYLKGIIKLLNWEKININFLRA